MDIKIFPQVFPTPANFLVGKIYNNNLRFILLIYASAIPTCPIAILEFRREWNETLNIYTPAIVLNVVTFSFMGLIFVLFNFD